MRIVSSIQISDREGSWAYSCGPKYEKFWKLAYCCLWLTGLTVTALGDSDSHFPEVGAGGFVKLVLSKTIYKNTFLR